MNYWFLVFSIGFSFLIGVLLENSSWEERAKKLQPFTVDGQVYKIVKVEVKQ